jgi:hypothetical protein
MQHLLSLVAAATALASSTPDRDAVAIGSPVAVSACAVTDLYIPALAVEFGPPINYRALLLTFRNTDDVAATQVTFDVTHGGEHTMVIDRGRFSKGVAIEHLFDDEFAGGGAGPDVCSVASITFADGRRWTAPNHGTAMRTSLR